MMRHAKISWSLIGVWTRKPHKHRNKNKCVFCISYFMRSWRLPVARATTQNVWSWPIYVSPDRLAPETSKYSNKIVIKLVICWDAIALVLFLLLSCASPFVLLRRQWSSIKGRRDKLNGSSEGSAHRPHFVEDKNFPQSLRLLCMKNGAAFIYRVFEIGGLLW